MIEKYKGWSPDRNKKAVDQFGFVDIVSVFHSGVMPATQAAGSDVYNGIEDPSSILGKPADVFEAMAMQQSINEYKPDGKSGEGQ